MCLLDFFVNRYALQRGIELLQLNALGRILLVLGGNVARSARQAGAFVLRAFQNHLHAVDTFLSHECW